MEHEEREEIPWSNLVAQVDEGSDRRWYIGAIAVGLVVVAFVGLRFLSATNAGTPPTEPGAQPAPSTTSSTDTAVRGASLIIAEEDLTSVTAVDTMHVATRAEWFVADFFTLDGSQATVADLRDALVDGLDAVDLPHDDDQAPGTFVEWAKAVAVRDLQPSSFEVDVAYRAITEVDDGYVRDPVRFVTVGVSVSGNVPVVTTLPVPIDPWNG